MQQALGNAIPTTELRYGAYVVDVVAPVTEGTIDDRTALQNTEARAIEAQRYTVDQRASLTITVAEPSGQIQVGPEEIILQFSINVPFSPLPNEHLWQRAIADFVAADPQVGYVELIVQPGPPRSFRNADCFF